MLRHIFLQELGGSSYIFGTGSVVIVGLGTGLRPGIFRAGATDELPADDAAVFLFELGGKKVRIGQVNTVDLDDVFARQADLESQMQSMMDDNDYDLFLLIATNILNSDSELLVIGDPAEKVEAAFGKKLNENKRMNLPGVVSRKKQVVPPLTDAFEG